MFRLFTSLSRSYLLKQRVFSILSVVLRDLTNRYQSNLAVMKGVVSFVGGMIRQLIELLGSCTLRNAEACSCLTEHHKFELTCFRLMQNAKNDRKFVLHSCLLLRTLLSNCHDNEEELVKAGLMEFLESVKSMDSAVNIAVVQLKRSILSVPFTPWSV